MELFHWVSAGVQFLLAFLGIIIALNYKWAAKHRRKIICSFAFLGAIGIYAAIEQSARSATATAKTNAELSTSLENLDKATTENSRLQRLNTELQQRIIASNETIADLAQKNIDSVIGGDSFCYMTFASFTSLGGDPIWVHVGQYPLYEVEARVVDLEDFKEVSTFEDLFASQRTIKIGRVIPHSARKTGPVIPFSNQEQQDFNIFFSARNGFWIQNLKLRRVDGNWVSAIRVMGNGQSAAIFEKVNPNFPRTPAGTVEW